jgi:hypothetical protein
MNYSDPKYKYPNPKRVKPRSHLKPVAAEVSLDVNPASEPKLLEAPKPRNILHAFFSPYFYDQLKYEEDTYFQTPKGQWVKITAVFSCVSTGRTDQLMKFSDTKYLGPVYEDTKKSVPRGKPFPPTTNADESVKSERAKPKKPESYRPENSFKNSYYQTMYNNFKVYSEEDI